MSTVVLLPWVLLPVSLPLVPPLPANPVPVSLASSSSGSTDQPYYTILHKGLDHLWISVFVEDPRTHAQRILRDDCIWLLFSAELM